MPLLSDKFHYGICERMRCQWQCDVAAPVAQGIDWAEVSSVLLALVTGLIEPRDADGKVLLTKNKVWLCRCGASTKKPFCDGTHSKIGFQAAAKAVPGSAEGD
jgi:CDGSH-type Zn-finger protein